MGLIAYHGKQVVKDFYVDRLQTHYDADEFIQGKYWENGKGCAVGCLVHQSDDAHEAVEEQLGFPRWLVRLMDRLFEGQSNGEAKEFPLRITKAVPVGLAEEKFNLVKARFFHWLLVDAEYGVIRFAKTDQTKAAIVNVGQLYEQVCNGQEVAVEKWQEVRQEARSAADAAAYAADAADAAAYAADAADAAAAAAYAADAAAAAAYAADADADAAYARKSHFKRMADKLVSLFEAA